jgi:uncharacterized membrane protein
MQIYEKVLLAILLIALVDASYMVLVYFQPAALSCPASGLIDCSAVLQSVYAKVFGVIPLSLFGLLWAIVALVFFRYARNTEMAMVWYLLGLGGVAYSVASMYALGKICEYCSILDISIIASAMLLYVVQMGHRRASA